MRKIVKLSEENLISGRLDEEGKARLLHSRNALCESVTGGCVIVFHYCDIQHAAKRSERVCIFCDEDELIYASDSEKCMSHARAADDKEPPFAQLGSFFLHLTADDIYGLEDYENRITDLEDRMLTSTLVRKESTGAIIALRRELLKVKRYYEQLGFIAGELAENKDDLFPPEAQKRFAYFQRRMERILLSITGLREYITQIREAYQAQMDIEQNNTMRLFTVITAIFLPLTLIVGWYGMNLKMPEFAWEHGYLFVIALSIVTLVLCILLFKRKKWF